MGIGKLTADVFFKHAAGIWVLRQAQTRRLFHLTVESVFLYAPFLIPRQLAHTDDRQDELAAQESGCCDRQWHGVGVRMHPMQCSANDGLHAGVQEHRRRLPNRQRCFLSLPKHRRAACRYTKMGWSGNYEPSYIIPTAIAAADEQVGNKDGVADLDFVTGPSVLSNTRSLQPIYPMRQGIVEDWNTMERLWQRCFFEYLRCDPEEHHVLLVSCVRRCLVIDQTRLRVCR